MSLPLTLISPDFVPESRSERSLRESEEHLRAMFASAIVGIAILTLEGKFLQVNDAFCAITGYSREELCSKEKACAAITHPDDLPRKHQLLTELVLGERRSFVLEMRYITKMGGTVWVQNSVSVARDESGRAISLIALCQDITERKRAEQEVREARDAAEAANRAKDRFLAVLSHELRTPLAPVVMALDCIATSPALPEVLREDITMIRRNVDMECRLIDDLLDLSRVINGKLRLQMQQTSAHDVLRHAMQTCATEIAAKQLTIETAFLASADSVLGDSARLQQVFWNLMRNAVKFSPIGNHIVIETATEDEQIIIRVRDFGVGIAKDVLPKLFEAFQQGDSRIHREFGGMGLGLAIAKAVVEMHGGSISAHSEGVGRGAEFTVTMKTINIAACPAPTTQPPAPKQFDGCRGKVLLVEDHPDTARTLSRLLSISGYNVSTAHSVSAALTIADEQSFDVVISDIGLPDASGYDLMKQLRNRHNIRGIALSGYGMEEDMRRSREAGFIDHVVKPVNFMQLQQIIDRVAHA